MTDLDPIVHEFLVESYENLDQLDNDLVALEQQPDDREILNGIFRTIHTIKGTCGFLGFTKLESVTHVGENLLSRLRDGGIPLDAEITTALLDLVDAVRKILTRIESSGAEGEDDYGTLVARLAQLQERSSRESPTEPTQAADDGWGGERDSPAKQFQKTEVAEEQAQSENARIEAADPQPQSSGSVVDPLREEPGVEARKGVEALRAPEEGRPSSLSETAIRVNVERLDELMNLVGELVLARNEILQFEPTKKDLGFHATVQRLNLITTELQEEVMKTRMQPIATIWDRFPPMVRSLAKACGKPVRVEMHGRDTELDKTLVEAIKDPLTAIIRNAVDHGIEPPEVRTSSGKPPEGRLSLRGYQEGGQINIEISDDGSGIDIEKVKAKAVAQGLVSLERIDRFSDREILQLIFTPSFSTAERVTNVSGRGVGMDVVKTNIERIGGTIEVESQRGQGTTLKIRIPLTLAIIPALITTCEGQRYAIPQRNLLELVRIEGNRKDRGIEFVQGTPVYRLRGRLLPLVFLSEVLGVPDDRTAKNSPGDETRVFNVVVLLANGEQFGLVVDDVSHAQEIVVKPLGRLLERINCFGGATIMGDGQVALILDVRGLAERAGVLSENRAPVMPHMASSTSEADDNQEMLLVFSAGKDRRMAIPLSTVHRVEEFETSALEYVGDRPVVQYGGGILALIDLANLLEPGNAPAGERLTVVVCSIEGRLLGLLVGEILGVAEFPGSFESCAGEQGVLGSAIVGGRVTSLIDLAARVRTFYPELLQQGERQMGA